MHGGPVVNESHSRQMTQVMGDLGFLYLENVASYCLQWCSRWRLPGRCTTPRMLIGILSTDLEEVACGQKELFPTF